MSKKYKFNHPIQAAKPAPIDTFQVNLAEVKLPEVDNNQLRASKDDWAQYGDNNLFPDYLMKSVKKSTRHSAFISLRENLIKGGGISYSNDVKEFMENLDEEGQTIEELFEDIANDLAIQETFAVFVRYNADRTRIIHLDFQDASKVRPKKELDDMGKVQGYYVSGDWSDVKRYKPEYFPKFNPFPRDASGNLVAPKHTKELFFYHKRANGQPYLPEISYGSCLNYVQMEYETSKYGLNAMLNGFFASAIMTITASMTPEQKRAYHQSIQRTLVGSENASKLIVNIQESDSKVTVTPLNGGDSTPMLKALTDMAEVAICTAHRAQPVLAGIASQGSTLGSDGKLIKVSQELYFNNVITHLQKPVLAFLKKVLKFNQVEKYDLSIESLNLVSEDCPEWVETDLIKPLDVALKYGWKKENVRDELLTLPSAPTAAPSPAADAPMDSPYPASDDLD
ncbi:hypothetical protein I2I05_08535 [Hymenobacter sp. BT683]|uniref:Portal protein n=1 Tax=Hymenobacter jeongseonensis TaxID=2791027 RepID=A0ABS0IHP6_9BACT|nr:hypothetical protein [Hymenobacter jeongseonensis]MBF9237443.1 hypothetical protein [Hymenobacter jeongseonensis]